MKKLYIIVPAYNEAETFSASKARLDQVLSGLIMDQEVSSDSQLVFVDDGSTDQTWALITQAAQLNAHITGIKLSRNYGHQNAIMAALMQTMAHGGDLFVTIDADLQDDETKIKEMVSASETYDVVYGVRESRSSDTMFKRQTALWFYGLMTRLHVDMVPNSADYRLMTKRAVAEVLKYEETNLFLRGIIPQIGFPSTQVYYDRKERTMGTSKYPLKKMVMFAWSGITSFTIAPIRLILLMGIWSVLLAMLMSGYTIIRYVTGHTAVGWSSLIISIWFLGGVQLLSVAVLGEYVGKIFQEVKHRPRFVIETDLSEPHK